MQRRYSEPNTYIDTPPSIPLNSDELYDDVAGPEVCSGLKCNIKLLRQVTQVYLLSNKKQKKTYVGEMSTFHGIINKKRNTGGTQGGFSFYCYLLQIRKDIGFNNNTRVLLLIIVIHF